MAEPKYKVGDVFKDRSGDLHEVFAVIRATDGGMRYWIDDNGDRSPWTIDEIALGRHSKVEPFFGVGKTYARPLHGARYEVVEIREVNGRWWAWAVNGGIMVTLAGYDFQDMIEV